MAWHDKDAQKLPPNQVAAALWLLPLYLILDFIPWIELEYQSVTLWEYASWWGKAYVVLVYGGFAAAVAFAVFHR